VLSDNNKARVVAGFILIKICLPTIG